MLRAALYARFSTDMQNPRSADDQLYELRALAERLGAVIVAEFKDEAISGGHDNRPGRIALMAAAGRRGFNVVLAESINRLSRSGGGTFDAYEDLAALGVKLHTIEQGAVDLTRTAVEALKSALSMEEWGNKVRRGQRAVIRDGRHNGGKPYGYRDVIVHDARGDRIGGILEIDAAQAAVVRRIAAELLAGGSIVKIAHRLNRDAVPAPGGRGWTYSTIAGRGTAFGMLRNPIYAGEIVWGRSRELKDRRSGKRRKIFIPESDWVRHPAPQLRILDAATWASLQVRLDSISDLVRKAGNPSAANRPRRLFSGLARCGVCGATLQTSGPDRRYRCNARLAKGPAACANGRTAAGDRFEALALETLRRVLLHPAAIEAFVREYHQAQRDRAKSAAGERGQLGRQLADAQARAGRLVDQVAAGHLKGPTVTAKLQELERQAEQAQAALARLDNDAEVVALHPHAAQRYRQMVEDLQAALANPAAAIQDGPERDAVRQALRQVVRAVYLIPGERRGEWSVRVDGDLSALLERAQPDALQRFKEA